MSKKRSKDEELHTEAIKLQMDRKFHSAIPRPGYIPIQMGSFRDAEVHRRIVDLLSRAIELAPGIDYYVYLRAGVHLGARDFEAALSDYNAVIGRGGEYAKHAHEGLISLFLTRGEKAKAKAILAQVNVGEARASHQAKKLRDFELWW